MAFGSLIPFRNETKGIKMPEKKKLVHFIRGPYRQNLSVIRKTVFTFTCSIKIVWLVIITANNRCVQVFKYIYVHKHNELFLLLFYTLFFFCCFIMWSGFAIGTIQRKYNCKTGCNHRLKNATNIGYKQTGLMYWLHACIHITVIVVHTV